MNDHAGAETLTVDELLRLRMRALGLSLEDAGETRGIRRTGSGAAGGSTGDTGGAGNTDGAEGAEGAARIAATARHMLAVQGQDWRSARWALGVRAPGTTVNDVHEAFNRGEIVRSWPMRGTIHVLAAEDIGWMQQATNRRVLAGAPKRRQFLGLDDQTLDRLVDVSLAALAGGTSLDRDELATVWTEAGIEWQSNWRYHVIWWLCQNGLAVFGPVSEGGEPRLVAAATWIRAPRQLHGDDALAELAARYASARGAVSAKDLAWWAGLTASEARRGLSHAHESGRLVEVRLQQSDGDAASVDAGTGSAGEGSAGEVGAPTLWADPAQLARSQPVPEWFLLPAFDEHLLGYQDRTAQLEPSHLARIVPGRNGMFLATVVREGRVVGTWKKGMRKSGSLQLTELPGHVIDPMTPELQQLADAWADFHGIERRPITLA